MEAEQSATTVPATATQAQVDAVYSYAANLLVEQKKPVDEVVRSLREYGLGEEDANAVVAGLQGQIRRIKKSRAQKDMLYGGLWCIGGAIATVANIGFIFWGAIVFGAVQFFRGVANYSSGE